MEHDKTGHVIFHQGDKGDAFYVIQSGEAHVMVHEQNYLRVGDKVETRSELQPDRH